MTAVPHLGARVKVNRVHVTAEAHIGARRRLHRPLALRVRHATGDCDLPGDVQRSDLCIEPLRSEWLLQLPPSPLVLPSFNPEDRKAGMLPVALNATKLTRSC